jgi:hypothetical protein
MNTAEEKKEEVLRETNTAQSIFISMLDRLDKTHADEIRFDIPMHGDLDFSLLKDREFNHVTSIIFDEKGEVTALRNIPEGIKKVICPNQILTGLSYLPETVEEVDVTGNYLQRFDAKSLKVLKILKLSNNDLERIDNLPEELEELECENNQLTQLDLAGCPNIKKLHCSNNQLLVISNPPKTLVDLDMENNPFIEISHDVAEEDKVKTEKRVDYLESLKDYFEMKQKYEEKKKQLKKTAYDRMKTKKGKKQLGDINAPCVSCKRPVGTIFTRKDGRYLAICGDKQSPCKLNIQIYSGNYFNNETLLSIYQEDLEKTKEEIIKQKMNTLFSYTSEERSVSEFKKLLDHYNQDSKMYKDLLQKYKELNDNEEKKIVIEKSSQQIFSILEDLKKQIDEYEKTSNRKALMSALHLYKRDLIPAIQSRRLHKYEIMEMNLNADNNGSTLFQKELALNKMDFKFGEDPRVIKFIK